MRGDEQIQEEKGKAPCEIGGGMVQTIDSKTHIGEDENKNDEYRTNDVCHVRHDLCS